MGNFDIAELAVKISCGATNELIYDDKGMPSVMVKIPKMTWAELGVGTSSEPFPAFIVNGKAIDALYFPKYQACVQNNRAYSLPGVDPKSLVNYDQSIAYSSNKGEGWHCITRLEWMVLALWCIKNGHQPLGNNNYGKDITESTRKAVPTYFEDGKVCRVAVGTGPLEWSHNGAADGVWDMCGNVWEWTTGFRLVHGELQVLSRDGVTFGNDGADPENSQASDSPLWRAINGTTGALIIPNGSGTTPNSLKIDRVAGKAKWITGSITTKEDNAYNCKFSDVSCDSNICDAAKHILMALGMLKTNESSDLKDDIFWYNNGAEERLFHCGGDWGHSVSAGVFAVSGNGPRSDSNRNLGFRCAFVKLPTA